MKRLIALATLLVSTTATSAAAPGARPSPILGRWTGVAHEVSAHFRYDFPVDIEISVRGGKLVMRDLDRRRLTTPLASLKQVGDHYTATMATDPWGTASITLALSPRDGTLRYHIAGGGMAAAEENVAQLHRGDASVRRFQISRIDRSGNRILDYRYVVPRPRNDGIPVSSASAQGLDPTALEKAVRAVLAEKGDPAGTQTEGLLVMRHGKLVLDEYFWGQDVGNPHMISSCAKSVTSIIAGVAWDRGKLSLDAPVMTYLPNNAGSLWAKAKYPITVRSVLSMASGTQWDDTHAEGAPSVKLLQTNDVARYMTDQPLVAAPGSLYNYNNGLPTLAGLTIKNATSEPFDMLARDALFQPLGIDNYRWTQMREGGALAAGGLYLTPRDMVKIGETMLRDGTWRGRRIVSAAWVKESTRQQTPKNGYPYGFYWHLNTPGNQIFKGPSAFMALGQGGQLIAVFPSLDMVVVATSSNWQRAGIKAMPAEIVNAVIAAASSGHGAKAE